MVVMTEDTLKKRFWEATEEKEKLDASTADMRADRDKLVEENAPREVEIRRLGKAIKAMEQPKREELDSELARIARALGGKVGERP